MLIHVSNSPLSALLKPSSHHRWCASRAWDHKEFSSLLIGEDAQGPVFHLFFLASRFGVVALIDTSVGMDPSAGETVDRNGACSLGHLGNGTILLRDMMEGGL